VHKISYFNRKLHKDEVQRQRDRALNGGNDELESGSDMEIDEGFSVPGRVWNKLYRFVLLFSLSLDTSNLFLVIYFGINLPCTIHNRYISGIVNFKKHSALTFIFPRFSL